MEHAKIFTSGRSQAVRLPKQFRFEGKEVAIKRFGNGVLLLPMDDPWELMEQALTEFEPDLLLERGDQGIQQRADMML